MSDAAPTSQKRFEELEKGSSLWSDAWKRLKKNRPAVVSGVILIVILLACIIYPEVSPYRYDEANLALKATAPSRDHLMGTDVFGRDMMSRVFFGGRVSFGVGLIATSISLAVGISWGGIAGYFGGRVDAIMMRIVDALYTFPFLIFVILLMVFFASKDSPAFSAWQSVIGLFTDHPEDPKYFPIFQIFIVFAALGSISWLTMARIVRGQVIALRNQPFVEAARSIGASDFGIIFRHLVPNALGPIIVYTTLTIPEVMLTEAFLSFLGLGTQEPLSSWGSLAATGTDGMVMYPWLLAFPSIMLAITLFCFNFLGDGLRDALDPKIRKD
jgi:oligopeptide transport system permease protein